MLHSLGHVTRLKRAPVLPHVPRFRTRSRCGRDLTLPRAVRPIDRQRRALMLSRVPRLQTHLSMQEGSGVVTCGRARRPAEKGSDIATCPMAPGPPPGAGRLWSRHVRPGPSPDREGLWCRHVSHGSRPASRCGGFWCHHVPRGSQLPRRAHAFPRRLISCSSWPHQTRGASSALNAYKTSHT
jgi:hypothetical protein